MPWQIYIYIYASKNAAAELTFLHLYHRTHKLHFQDNTLSTSPLSCGFKLMKLQTFNFVQLKKTDTWCI